MVKVLKKYSKINYAFVLGRLSKKIGDNFQYFPVESWENEIKLGRKFGFDGVEWIISDFSNPIFNYNQIKNISNKLNCNKMKITSISLDFIMTKPLYLINRKDLIWVISKLNSIQNKINIPRITIPVEETCRYKNKIQKKKTIDCLSLIIKKLSKKSNICIETDLSFTELENLLKKKSLSNLNILIDIGNFRASGKNLTKFIKKFCDKIISFHIKFREKNYGKSKNIPKKFQELKIIDNQIKSLKKLQDLTFQTYRSNFNYLNDMVNNIKNFNEIIR
tara:strand:- start:6871 stop:7701 length:831 start_codon:yes stop_codon:yes gene_type:complete